MKRFLRLGLTAVLLAVMLLAISPASSILASTMYENVNSGDDDDRNCYATLAWLGQTFTPETAHTITSVKIKAWRAEGGTPGVVTLEIYATSEGVPTGSLLASGTTNGNTLSTSAGEWREITLGAGAELTDGVMYAWTVRPEGNVLLDRLMMRCIGSNVYDGGTMIQAIPGSSENWVTVGSVELMFEEWGEPLIIEAPEASTQDATDVEYNSGSQWFEATLNGTVVDDGGEACSAGFLYQIKDADDWKWANASGTYVTDETFNALLINLLSETTYEFKAWVENSEDVGEGAILEFTTEWVVSVPTVVTYGYPIILGDYDCRIYGGIGYDGGSLCDAWFEWREEGEENWDEEQSATNFIINSGFEVELSGNWFKDGSGTIARSTEKLKTGDYSLKVVSTGGLTAGLELIEQYERLRDVQVTIGAWVWSSEAGVGTVSIYDGISVHSDGHTGSSTWEWLTVSRSILPNAGLIYGGVYVTQADKTVYFDDVAFVRGNTVSSSGEYGELLETGETANVLISGLDQLVWYEFRMLAENDEGIGTGGIASFILHGDLDDPVVRTDGILFLKNTSVRLCGTLVEDSGCGCFVRFDWRKVGSSKWHETPIGGTLYSGEDWTQEITNLLPETNYEYRAKARHSILHSEYVYGEIKVLYTEETIRTPSISSSSAEYYDSTTFYLTGSCVYDGGSECDAWFQYRLLGATGWDETDITSGLTTGYEWSKLVYNLKPQFYYEYRAVAENDIGFGFGDIEQFYVDVPEVDRPPVPFDPMGGIDRLLERFSLNNQGGHFIMLILGMALMFGVFYTSKVLRVLVPLLVFAVAIAVGWIELWIILLLALSAGVIIFGLVRKQVAGGG